MTEGMTGSTPFPNSKIRSGVYLITCLPGSRSYVGSSSHIYQRWQQHRKSLRRGTHPLSDMQEDWNEFGEDKFWFAIDVETADKKERLIREQQLIDELTAKGSIYNILLFADVKGSHPAESTRKKMRAWIPSPLTRQRMSAAKKGKRTTASTSAEARSKISYSRQGVKHPLAKFTEEDIRHIRRRLKAGDSGRQIARDFGVSPATISDIKSKRTWGHINEELESN